MDDFMLPVDVFVHDTDDDGKIERLGAIRVEDLNSPDRPGVWLSLEHPGAGGAPHYLGVVHLDPAEARQVAEQLLAHADAADRR